MGNVGGGGEGWAIFQKVYRGGTKAKNSEYKSQTNEEKMWL